MSMTAHLGHGWSCNNRSSIQFSCLSLYAVFLKEEKFDSRQCNSLQKLASVLFRMPESSFGSCYSPNVTRFFHVFHENLPLLALRWV